MIGQVRLAGLAAVDLLGVEVDVVGEAHLRGRGDKWALLPPALADPCKGEFEGGSG